MNATDQFTLLKRICDRLEDAALAAGQLPGHKPLTKLIADARRLADAWKWDQEAELPETRPMPETRPPMTPYEAGRLACQRGCYRILACPKNPVEECEWLRGYDDAKAEQTQPKTTRN